MPEDIISFEKSEELLLWVNMAKLDICLSKRDASIILSYMEGHDYALGVKDGNLVRMDVAEEQGEIVPYTLDEVIDDVCEWNYELMKDAVNGMANPNSFTDFCNYKDAYDALKEDEPYLDKMFMQTKFGRETIQLAQAMIKEVVGENCMSTENLSIQLAENLEEQKKARSR